MEKLLLSLFRILCLFLLSLIVEACGASTTQLSEATQTGEGDIHLLEQATTEIPTPTTIPPTKTKTPTLEPTSTPTPRIKQYANCGAENFKGCYISARELTNGEYRKWLEVNFSSSDIPSPDPDKVFIFGGDTFIYYAGELSSDLDQTVKSFRAGFTYGYTKGSVYFDGVSRETIFAVAPIEFAVPGRSGYTEMVIAVLEKPVNWSDEEMGKYLQEWANKGKLRLAGFSSDDEVQKTFNLLTNTNYPNIHDRIELFQDTLDPSYISEDGIVLESFFLR